MPVYIYLNSESKEFKSADIITLRLKTKNIFKNKTYFKNLPLGYQKEYILIDKKEKIISCKIDFFIIQSFSIFTESWPTSCLKVKE